MYVDWEYYKIFYYVAKYQNFTKAARVLGNNQPNITHSMNRLESQLNCVLFIRSNRGVTLTPEGEMLYLSLIHISGCCGVPELGLLMWLPRSRCLYGSDGVRLGMPLIRP